jgi:hypothetical protein
MQVPDRMRKSVVFLYYDDTAGALHPAGTAFFAAYPLPRTADRGVGTLITAHHVLAEIRANSVSGNAYVRINTVDGGASVFATSLDEWKHDEDVRVDCAYFPWQPTPELRLDLMPWFLGSAATDEVIDREGIGLGDEIFMVGLFRNHVGNDRNEPIVRVGNIAALPTDRIRLKFPYGESRAILVEARSLGGLSGSPLFVHMGFSRWREGQGIVMQAQGPMPFYFLGVMHGHWTIQRAESDALTVDEKAEDEEFARGLPLLRLVAIEPDDVKDQARIAKPAQRQPNEWPLSVRWAN